MIKQLPGAPVKAFASGVRSCTLKIGDEWYRLKGSGNNDEGFIVKCKLQKVGQSDEMKFTRQIRGSAWRHTSLRENYIAAHLGNTTEPKGILPANSAMGMYVYDAPNQPFGPDTEEHESMVPACIVQRTLGDRRLGTHV